MSPLISIHFLQRQSDDKLVALARAGNERAFETLVRRYRRPLLAYARRLSGPGGRAEDAVQQALLQAWIALCADAEPHQVRPWLFRIVHNVVVSGLRRQQHPCVELDEALDTAERVAGADVRIECREALSGLAALPELQRRAIVLTAFGGNSHGEVAATLGLTDGAVRGLVYRARAALRSAAAVLPLPIARWAANRSPRRTSLLERAGELLGGGGVAGAGGILVKGGVTAATVGALATATQIFIPAVPVQHHVRPRIAPVAGATTRKEASTQATSHGPGSPITSAAAGSTRFGATAPGSRGVGSPGDRGRTVMRSGSGSGRGAGPAATGGRSGPGDGGSGSTGPSGGSGRDGGGGSGPGGGGGSGSKSTPGGDGSSSGSTSSTGGPVATIAGGGDGRRGGGGGGGKDGGGSSASSTSVTTSGSGDGGFVTTTTSGGSSDGGSGGGSGGGTDGGSGDGGDGGLLTTSGH